MTLLACIPITGCLTLAEVAACSLTTADQTFALGAGTQVIFEQSDGDDILAITESDKSILVPGHAAMGNSASALSDALLVLNETYIASDNFTALPITAFIEPTANNYNVIGVDVFLADFNSTKTGGFLRGLGFAAGSSKDGGRAYGMYGAAQHYAGNATIIEGGFFSVNGFDFSGGVVTDYVGLEVLFSIFDLVPPINNYGIIVNDVSGATTKNRAIETRAGHVVFNENSDDDTDFRVEGATNTHLLFTDGSADRMGINDSTPDAKLDIVQSDDAAAIPVVELEQLDLSEEFFNFVGTVATGNPIEAVGAKTLTVTHFVRVAINGAFLYAPVGTIA